MMGLGNRDENRIVFSCVRADSDKKAQNLKFCSDAYNLLFVTKGIGRYVVEGREYHLTAGSISISKPFEYSCIEIASDTPYELYTLQFSPQDLTDENFALLESAIEESRCHHVTAEAYDTMLSAFLRSQTTARLFAQHADAYYRTLLSEIVCLLSLAQIEHELTDESELGVKVIKYVNEYVTRNPTLEFLAKKFFVSKYHLCRAFKKHNGVSVHGYIVQKRILMAKGLIDGGIGAADAAHKAGFHDYSAFYRAFVRIIGHPPVSTRT